MRILTVAFFDDNYGDMLIRTCFLQLMKVALGNLGVGDYTLDVMPLKAPRDEQVEQADLIVFPGGAMFGINYLGVADYIERVLNIADAKGTPVIFSSLGFNHMEEGEEHDDRLHQILSRPCIRAVTVRDSEDIFRRYAGDQRYQVQPVCDPACWTEAVYAQDIEAAYERKRTRGKKLVGINVVRGGLFQANGIDWTLTGEEKYLYALSQMLDERGIDYRFFTNGQTWDINTMKHFSDRYHIPKEKLIFSDTSREVVQTIAEFDAVVAIRMHSAIIAYAMGVPTINYVWNPKIPELYRKIGYPERAVSPEDWSAEKAMEWLDVLLGEESYRPDPEVLMTLYRSLFETLGGLIGAREHGEMYEYERVCALLREMRVPADEDTTDLRTKLKRAESRYYALFKSDDRKKGEIRKLTAENETLQHQIAELREKLEEESAARRTAEEALEALNSKRSFRIYQKLTGGSKKES